jgi:hypothetical protein
MRLYYDCPIKALYMMKHFGVRIGSRQLEMTADGVEIFTEYTERDILQLMILGILLPTLEVHVESEQIFEPRFQDEIKLHFREDTGGIKYQEIIMRDNKHFFQAIKENLDNQTK